MDQDIRITTNGRCEVSVDRNVQGIVIIFGDIEHSGTEVLRTRGGLAYEDIENCAGHRIFNATQGTSESTDRRDVNFVPEVFSTFNKGSL